MWGSRHLTWTFFTCVLSFSDLSVAESQCNSCNPLVLISIFVLLCSDIVQLHTWTEEFDVYIFLMYPEEGGNRLLWNINDHLFVMSEMVSFEQFVHRSIIHYVQGLGTQWISGTFSEVCKNARGIFNLQFLVMGSTREILLIWWLIASIGCLHWGLVFFCGMKQSVYSCDRGLKCCGTYIEEQREFIGTPFCFRHPYQSNYVSVEPSWKILIHGLHNVLLFMELCLLSITAFWDVVLYSFVGV